MMYQCVMGMKFVLLIKKNEPSQTEAFSAQRKIELNLKECSLDSC